MNGAAVDSDGSVIVSSANSMEGFYKVDIKDLNAVKIVTTGKVYNASDLANANLLFQKNIKNTLGAAELKKVDVIGNDFISRFLYPKNPFNTLLFKFWECNKTSLFRPAFYNFNILGFFFC